MRFKALRHKQYKEIFGIFMTYENGPEVGQSAIPDLINIEATMEKLIEFNAAYPLAIEQLADYDLVEISLLIIEKK